VGEVIVLRDLPKKEDNLMTGNGNRSQDIVKNTLEQLSPEDRKTVLAEGINTLSDSLQKDVATETARALPDSLQQEVAAETVQTLPGEVQKDVAAEATRTLPTEDKKEIVAEAARTLPDEVKRDVVAKAVQAMPAEDRKDIAVRAFHDLSAKDQQDVAGNPSQRVTDMIWLMVVGTFSAVLLVSAIGLLFVAIFPPQGNTDAVQVMLPVFTSIAGILAGFIGGRASAGG